MHRCTATTGRLVALTLWLALGTPALSLAEDRATAAASADGAESASGSPGTSAAEPAADEVPASDPGAGASAASAADVATAEATEPARTPKPEIEEIVVTAERRPGNVQDTPIAISVFDMMELDTGGIQDFEGLSFSIPNFHYGEVLGAANITIRGIATSGGDQATAVHIDGIYQDNPYTVSGDSFYDLQRIEVLRGPQGTLYGRNATGGTINILTRPPVFDFETMGDVQVGSYDEIRLRGVLNVPLVEDVLAMRLSGVFNRRHGYTENLTTRSASDALDDDRSWSLRSQVLLQPTESIEWITRFTVVHDRSNGLGIKIEGDYPASVPLLPLPPPLDQRDIYFYAPQPNPTDPRQIYLDTDTQNDRDLYMGSTRLSWLIPESGFFGEPTLNVQGGYQYSAQEGVGDADFSNAYAIGVPGGPNAGPFRMLVAELDGSLAEWVVEANLDVHKPLEPDWMSLRWMVGVFYLQTFTELTTYTEANLELGITGFRPTLGQSSSLSRATAYAKSAAGFANVDWILWDQLTLYGGLRYSWDWKKGEIYAPQVDFDLPDLPNATFPCIVPELDEMRARSWDGITGRLGAEWQYRDDKMVYAQFSTGYKAGTLGLPVGADACTRTEVPDAEPEQVLAWEIGSKNQFFERKLQLNVTGFAYLYDDIQVTTLVQDSLVTENANSARVLGAEIEAVALPFADFSPPVFSIDTLALTFLFGYTNSEFTDYTNGCLVEEPTTCNTGVPPPPGAPGPQDWTGNQLPRAPEYTITLMAQYEQDLGRFGTLTPYMRYYYSDQLYFRAANRPRDLQPSYQFLDASLTWRDSSDRFSIEGFVNNIFDEDVIATKLISSPLVGSPTVAAYSPPRTWGVRAGFVW